jgi:hypothetical protein
MKKLVIGFMSLLSIAAMAKEGGNGGGAFVCRNTNGQVLSAELVDFYEGKTEYKLTIPKSNAGIEDQVNKAVVKFISASPADTAAFMESIQNVQKIMNIVPNAKLENTNDFNLRIAPKTCPGGKIRFEQLANYTDDDKLTVDQDIYDFLSNTDKAGLVLHEASYLLARQWHDAVSSREARRLTAHLFSRLGATAITQDILDMNLIDPDSNKKWMCSVLGVAVLYKDFRTPENAESFKKIQQYSAVFTGYGSTLFKAQENTTKMYDSWNPYFQGQRPDFRSFCGASANFTVLEVILRRAWSTTRSDDVISCDRPWSPNFDCKEL